MVTNINGVSENLLLPVWTRAVETSRPNPIVRDLLAVKIMSRLNYDFSRFIYAWRVHLLMTIRTMLLDRAAESFIAMHPDAVVVNLGAGLCTRFSRVDNGRLSWFDMDLPEPIHVRKRFFAESKRHQMIAGNVMGDSWTGLMRPDDRPVLIISEGILMNLEKAQVRNLMNRLAATFPSAEMLFEMVSPGHAKRSRQQMMPGLTGEVFKWGFKHGREMEALHPAIRFLEEWNYYDFHRDRWRWLGWLARIRAFRDHFNHRVAHIRFEKKTGC